jgi:hypothetical protein
MKRLLLVAATVAALAVTASSTAARPSGLHIFDCLENGGAATLPAGTQVNVWMVWFDRNRGLVQDFLNAETMALTVNGVAVPGASAFWAPIEDHPSGALVTYWQYAAGVLVMPGDTFVIAIDTVLSHKLEHGKEDGRTLFFEPGSIFGGPVMCTITAV